MLDVTAFLDGCGLPLRSKNNDRDYHKTMDGHHFKEWVQNQLIPALEFDRFKTVIVLDNAPYHSVRLEKPPTRPSNKIIM